jgi:hypothetical protein
LIITIHETAADIVFPLMSPEFKDMTGPEKRDFVIAKVRDSIDENLDDLPLWRNISEERRDNLIAAVVEISVFFAKLDQTDALTDERRARRRDRNLKVATNKVERIKAVDRIRAARVARKLPTKEL